MVLSARCRVCGELIKYTREDPAILGEHILDNHPDITVTHFSCVNRKENGTNNTDVSSIKSKQYKKNTVETWRSGITPLKCPKCRIVSVPLVRRQRYKISRSLWGALIILGCWPFCLLPLMLNCCHSPTMRLYCPKCCYCFGIYNKCPDKPLVTP